MPPKETNRLVGYIIALLVAACGYFGIQMYLDGQESPKGAVRNIDIRSGHGAQPPPVSDGMIINEDLIGLPYIGGYYTDTKLSDVLLC